MFDLNRLYVDQAYREDRIQSGLRRRQQQLASAEAAETGPQVVHASRTARRGDRLVRAAGR